MATTTKIQTSITTTLPGSASSINGYVVDQGNTPALIAQTFPASSSATVFTLAFTTANLQSIFLVATQNCSIGLYNSTTLENTIALVAGVPYFWSLSSGLSNPFAANITSAEMTCTPAASLQGVILQT